MTKSRIIASFYDDTTPIFSLAKSKNNSEMPLSIVIYTDDREVAFSIEEATQLAYIITEFIKENS